MSDVLGLPREALDRARRSRDPRFDGKFFIAVLSTGIYCRPTCPVRLSSAVRYYATAAAAAEAGFRPCLRCRPEAAPGSPAWAGTSAVVRRALRLIQDGALDTGSVKELATRVGLGVRHLSRLVQEQVGASPLAIAQTRRLHFAKQLLDNTDLSMTEVALAAGFRSVRRFNEALKTTYKRSPREIRRRRTRSGESSDELTMQLAYRPPYDWDQVLMFLRQRSIPGLERVDASGFARTVRTSSGYAVIRISLAETAHTLQMRVRGGTPADLFELSSAARRVFDLSADPAQIAAAFGADCLLRKLVHQRPGLRIPGVFDPFECAVRAILGQQVNVEVERALTSRLVEFAGRSIDPIAADGLTRLFPSPEALAELDIEQLGLSSARVAAVRALARAVCDGSICFNDSAEQVTRSLAKLPGVGAWASEYVALRGLGDPDAFPSTDLTLRRGVSSGTVPSTARGLEARAEAWRPWRGYAAMYLWMAAPERIRPLSRRAGVSEHASRRGESPHRQLMASEI